MLSDPRDGDAAVLVVGVVILARDDEIEVGRGEAAALNTLGDELPAIGNDRAQGALEFGNIESGVDERGHQHVAGGAADHVDVGYAHAVTILWASAAAPKPLSMFTTAIPGAHEVSIALSAVTPPKATP